MPNKHLKKKKAKGADVEVYKIKPAKMYSTYSLDKYTPKEVGTFSTNTRGKVVNCNEAEFPQLISDIKFPLDLNIGLEDYYKERKSRLPDTLPLWQKFLRWICKTNFNIESVDVIARRGILKHIGYTLYNYHRNPWSFKFCKYRGKLYIYEMEKTGSSNVGEQHKRYLYWGIKFERCITRTGSGIRSCYSMVRASVGKYRVLLGAEIDAVRSRVDNSTEGESSRTTGDHREYVEIKTCFEKAVTKKLSFGWLQSYLAGIETLYYGFRDENGIVNTTREYKVSEIPGRSSWDGGAMFGLMSGIINWVYNKLEDGTSGTLIYIGNSSDVVLTRDAGHFLPAWYVDYVDNIDDELDCVDQDLEKQMDWSLY